MRPTKEIVSLFYYQHFGEKNIFLFLIVYHYFNYINAFLGRFPVLSGFPIKGILLYSNINNFRNRIYRQPKVDFLFSKFIISRTMFIKIASDIVSNHATFLYQIRFYFNNELPVLFVIYQPILLVLLYRHFLPNLESQF